MLFSWLFLFRNNSGHFKLIDEMKNLFVLPAQLIIAFLLFSGVLTAQQSDYGIIPGKSYLSFSRKSKAALQETAKPVVMVPPSCGKKRREMGHDLALPFGITVGYNYTKQFYNTSDLRLTDDSTGIFADGEANVQNSTAGEMNVVFRPDVWILPILNVYGMFGYSRSTTNPNFEVPSVTIRNLPIIGEITLDTTIQVSDELVFYGPVYGGGATVSAGFKNFFFLLDYHYVVTNPREIPENLTSHHFSGKLGLLLGRNEKKVKGSFWLGVNYVNDDRYFEGELDVQDILPELGLLFGETATYSGNLKAKQYWNLLAGVSMIINKHHILVAEAGYFKREQFAFSYGFRF
jgi:hypothetical protein